MQALDEVGVGLGEVAGEVGAGAAIPLADLNEIIFNLTCIEGQSYLVHISQGEYILSSCVHKSYKSVFNFSL